MPTTAVHDLPYPELSDAPNIPADIQALADAVETELSRQQSGTATVATIVGVASVAVAFPRIMASVPKISHGPLTNRPDLVNMTHGNVTTSGFTAYMSRTGGTGPVDFDWHASI